MKQAMGYFGLCGVLICGYQVPLLYARMSSKVDRDVSITTSTYCYTSHTHSPLYASYSHSTDTLHSRTPLIQLQRARKQLTEYLKQQYEAEILKSSASQQ
jgi:hypothetical protein